MKNHTYTRQKWGWLVIVWLVQSSSSPAATAARITPLVTLAVEERAGVARWSEPVTAGVPLPKGVVRDPSTLALLDEKQHPVQAHIKVVNRWWDDRSVKWIHVHFRTDVSPYGRRAFTLARGSERPPAPTTLKVADGRDRLTVSTGPLRFTVKKKNFNGIDEAWLDPEGEGRFDQARRLLAPHLGGPFMRAHGKEFRSSNDVDSQVVVEEQTPLYVVIKATGALTSEDHRKGFSYICRLTAYAGQPRIEAQLTVINTMGPKREDAVPLEQLAWQMPTTLKRSQVLIGGEIKVHDARLKPNQSTWICQSSSDHYELGGVLEGSGKGKTNKPLTTGWVSLSDEKRGVAAGVRWFWQMYPKAVEANGDGGLRIDLYPSRSKPMDIYTGVSRTHDLLFLFDGHGTTPDELRDTFAAFQKPLRAMAPLRWHCRDTKAFGNLVEADPSLFGNRRGILKTYLDWWTVNFDNIKRLREGRAFRGIYRDAYGWLDFGDGLHYVWQPGNSDPHNLAWDGNYYDFPHACLLHFLLTGRWEFFDFFIDHSRHLADVHFVHYDPDPVFIGSNRYCPPTDHVRIDPRKRGDFRTARVYVSNTFNHHKTQSLFENYLLTGDRRALDVALMGLKYAHDHDKADDAYNQPRGPGHQLLTLLTGYEFTGDRKYLDRCRRIVEFGKQAQRRYEGGFIDRRGQFFQFGIALEGLIKYYHVTNDEAIVPMVKAAIDFLISRNRYYTNCAHAAGFLYEKTGNKDYLDYGLRVVSRSSVLENPVKSTALTFRSAPYFFYYVADREALHLGEWK